jgi:serine/threonine protein phosphatase PrpC
MDIEEATQVVSKNLQEEKHALGVKRMGSTVAGVFIRNMEGTVFWAGDSRVYIYRSGELLFQTEDHTVVNDLMKVRPLTF